MRPAAGDIVHLRYRTDDGTPHWAADGAGLGQDAHGTCTWLDAVEPAGPMP